MVSKRTKSKRTIQPQGVQFEYFTSVNGIPFGILSEHNEFDFGEAGDPIHHFPHNRNIYCVTQRAGLNSSSSWFNLQLSNSYTSSNF